MMNRRVCFSGVLPTVRFLAVLVVAGGFIAGPAQAAFISLEPDNYTEGQAIPDFGVKLRSNWIDPPSTASYHRLFARATAGNSLGISASTGSKAYAFQGANANATSWNNGKVQATFDLPTNYVSIDVLWPTLAGWSEGAYVSALTRNTSGAFVTLQTVALNSKIGGSDQVAIFGSDIYALRVWSRDVPGFAQKAWGIDNFEFNDTDTSLNLELTSGQSVNAAGGIDLGQGDTLSGAGTIIGDVRNNAGEVSPGTSPGTINIDGDFHQGVDGVTTMELGGIALDQIVIDGDAFFGGTLDLVTLTDFVFSEGQVFELISYQSFQSEFDDVLGLSFVGGFFELAYGSEALSLTAHVVPVPAAVWLFASAVGALGWRRRCDRT